MKSHIASENVYTCYFIVHIHVCVLVCVRACVTICISAYA